MKSNVDLFNQAVELAKQEKYEEAAGIYLSLAMDGDRDSMFNLGVCYELGEGVGKNIPTAIHWYEKAANEGDAEAMQRLGDIFLNSIESRHDIEIAFEWIIRAVENGSTNALNTLAKCFAQGIGVNQSKENVLILLLPAAALGNDAAKANLLKMRGLPEESNDLDEDINQFLKNPYGGVYGVIGNMYRFGVGVHANVDEAIRFYKKSAETGVAQSKGALGSMYYHGEGVEKNMIEAGKYFKEAFDGGARSGICYYYGKMLYEGEGISVDKEEGKRILEIAAKTGDINAQRYLQDIYRYGIAIEIPTNAINNNGSNQTDNELYGYDFSLDD